jgi:hypothetical protein
LGRLLEHAEGLHSVALKMRQAAAQVLDKGGTLHIETQIFFCTSLFARMLKDLGALENMQANGAFQKPRAFTRRSDRER